MILNCQTIHAENDIQGTASEEPTRRRHDRKIQVQREGSAGKGRAPSLPPQSQFSYWPALLAAERPSRTREEIENAEKSGDVREKVGQESEVHRCNSSSIVQRIVTHSTRCEYLYRPDNNSATTNLRSTSKSEIRPRTEKRAHRGPSPRWGGGTRIYGQDLGVGKDQPPIIDRDRPPMHRRPLVTTTPGPAHCRVVLDDLPDDIGRGAPADQHPAPGTRHASGPARTPAPAIIPSLFRSRRRRSADGALIGLQQACAIVPVG